MDDERLVGRRKVVRKVSTIDIRAMQGRAEAPPSLLSAVREACINLGFFYLVGHGIDAAELDEVAAFGHKFFELPLAKKQRFATANPREKAGYVEQGKSNARADIKERLSVDGQWLDSCRGSREDQESLPVGFVEFTAPHLHKRKLIAAKILHVIEASLGEAKGALLRGFDEPDATLMFNGYPRWELSDNRAVNDGWSFSPHTDYGALTLLSQDQTAGLEVENLGGDWIDAPPVRGALVVNLGDLMSVWTNDLYVSSRHRVVNRGDQRRVSVALFLSPRVSVSIQCLRSCLGTDGRARYRPFLGGEYKAELMRSAKSPAGGPGNVHPTDAFRIGGK